LGIVAGAGMCGILAALVKGGTFEANSGGERIACAGMWGYTNKPKA